LPARPERLQQRHALAAAEDRAAPGSLYNVCDDEPVPRHVFYAELAKLVGAPPPRFVPPPPEQPTPPHEKGNRRIANRKLKGELQFHCRYPSFRDGLRASLATIARP